MKSLKWKLTWISAVKSVLGNGVCALLLGVLFALPARADYVGELETTKYFDPTTITLIKSRLATGGLLAGDEISYFIQFTPTDNGGNIGGGGFVTDYIPAGTQVVNAQFVRLDSSPDGYTQIAPPTPAAVYPAFVPMYSDTGIFYSTDARMSVYASPMSTTITSGNGYALATINPGCSGISLPTSTHNNWDNLMATRYRSSNAPNAGVACTTAMPAANLYLGTVGTNSSGYGLSPVAGPDTFLTLDYTGAVGPWQRISYPGSMKGTANGTALTGTTNSCVGGTLTSAGWVLSSANPLPINTTAVRFAAGKVTVGELFSVRITLKLTTNMPTSGIINNTEVFGGDISLDPGGVATGGGSHPSAWNQWKYHCPAVAISNSNLMVLKNLVGACAGAGCVPAAISAGVVPSVASLKLRYTIQYLNLSATTQTSVVLTDTLATGASYVAGSYSQLSGTAIGAPSGTTTLTFPTIASLAPGVGGVVQYDVNVTTAPADGTALINTAKMISTQVPTPGVTSKAIATVSTQANLWIGKSTSTPSVAPGNLATYTITIPNNGGTAVIASATKPLTVNDYLPTSGLGTAATNRFSYASLVSANTTTSAGVVTVVTPTVTITAPATAAANEQVQFVLPNGTTIPTFGKLTITFNATVGSNVPASATPYLNNVNAWYSDGPGGTGANSSMSENIGTAPVIVTAPMSLSKKVDCVYAGTNCVPYTNGTIAPLSKFKYKLSYSNVSLAALNNLVLTDTLPPNTTYVPTTAIRDGAVIADPTVAGQVLTFPTIPTLAASPASGYVTFDVQLGAAVTSGTDITNTAKITASTFLAGVQASVTTSVRNQANLQITKTASPATIQIGGTTTYTITVTNTGNAVASGIMIFDELPFTGSAADPFTRFNFNLGSSTFATTDTAANKLVAVTPTTSVPPTFAGYNVQANRQEVLWTFAPAKELGVGQSFALTYTATAGANVPASVAAYTSDVQAQYISATNQMQSSATNTAPVTIGGLDHIRILHSGTGLTCMPEPLTVKACGDAACSILYAGSVSTTLNGITGTITFAGSTTANLAQTTAGAFTLGATGTSPTPQTAARCFVGATETCTLTFSDAGFILSSVAGGTELTVPVQVAGVTSAPYQLRAVKKATTTAACTTALPAGAQTVNLGYECNDAPSCAPNNLLSVNNGTTSTVVQRNNNAPTLGYNYTSVSLTFDANGNAPFSFSYEDVGQITLRMQKTVNGANLLGNSNAFIVTPHHLAVDVCKTLTAGVCAYNTAATPIDGSGTVLAVAGTVSTQTGTAFNATVRSISANNNVTPSFGTAGSANGGTSPTTETVALTHTCVAPLIGTTAPTCPAAGTLYGTKSITRSTFNSGVATVSDLTWSEVGVITLTATNSTFMAAASTATGTSAKAGRFRPDHFDTVVAGQMLCVAGAGCTAPVTEMVYSGQVFKTVTVKVKNANDDLVSNYQGAFAKAVNLSAVDGAGGAPIAIAIGFLGGTTGVPSSVFGSSGGILSGVISSNTGAPWFTFAVTPSVPKNVFMRAVENAGDNVTSLRTTNSIEGGVKVVSGRTKISNAYGSEQLPLPVVATVQFYNSTGAWQTSSTDSVTSFNTATDLVVTIVKGSLGISVANAGAVTVTGGLRAFTLNAPGVSGSANISLNAPSYLFPVPGRVTFGVYKGANEFIYQREVY